MTQPAETAADPSLKRYERQISYPAWGRESQEKLSRSTALVVGVGALGSVIANTLARAGVGTLRIVDRDFLEWNNLQRQVLYTEEDVRNHLPKAVVAERHLREINSEINIEAIVADVDYGNIEQLCAGVDVIVDGTDNFEIRFLLNDAALKFGIPWVYGGCLGAEGQTMTILPGKTPCLRCIISDAPPPGTTPTCDTAGIMASIINVIASIQSLEAMKIMAGHLDQVSGTLDVIDLWYNRMRQVKLGDSAQSKTCPACGQGNYEWLRGERGGQSAILCGRNAVQLSFSQGEPVDLKSLATQLEAVGKVTVNPFLLRLTVDEYTLTLFPDRRCIVSGTDDPVQARAIHARYIGS